MLLFGFLVNKIVMFEFYWLNYSILNESYKDFALAPGAIFCYKLSVVMFFRSKKLTKKKCLEKMFKMGGSLLP